MMPSVRGRELKLQDAPECITIFIDALCARARIETEASTPKCAALLDALCARARIETQVLWQSYVMIL